MIELSLLGPPTVRVDGDEPPKELLWKKNLALLAYLARSPGGRRGREHLVGLLWGDRPEARARHSLNEALRVLRSSGGDSLIESSGGQIVLHESALALDTRRFQAAEAAGDWTGAARLVRGRFMEGFSVPSCSDFDDWLAAERFQLDARLVEVLTRRADQLVEQGDLSEARELADRALRLAPTSDVAARLALLVRALCGERSQAVEVYEAFAERLTVELGMEPDDATTELAERIRMERDWQLPDTVPPSERAARRPELVGRAEPLSQVMAELRAGFRDTTPRLVVIQGEPGVGKSRLAEEVLTRCRMDGVRTVQVKTVPADREIDGHTARALARALGREGDDHGALEEAVADAAAQGPLLLCVDDAEYVDDRSQGALHRILRDSSDLPVAVLLCVSWRSAQRALDELPAQLGRDFQGHVVTLEPLELDQVASLAQALIPDLDPDQARRLARRVHTDSAGLPLFALELLNAVRLGLELGRIRGVWPEPHRTLVQTFPGHLPDSVVAAIRVSYRRLGEPAQQLLAAASVLGDRVSGELLGHVCGLSGPPLLSSLDELEWQRWLVADHSGYTFVARVVRDVIARDMLTEGQRLRILAAAEVHSG